MLLGLPASYWLALRGHNPVYVARTLPQRVMLLHGARDYQVTNHGFELWQQGLNRRKPQFTPVHYSKLNHLLQEGKGKSRPARCEKPGHVPLYLIKNIASWVKIGI